MPEIKLTGKKTKTGEVLGASDVGTILWVKVNTEHQTKY